MRGEWLTVALGRWAHDAREHCLPDEDSYRRAALALLDGVDEEQLRRLGDAMGELLGGGGQLGELCVRERAAVLEMRAHAVETLAEAGGVLDYAAGRLGLAPRLVREDVERAGWWYSETDRRWSPPEAEAGAEEAAPEPDAPEPDASEPVEASDGWEHSPEPPEEPATAWVQAEASRIASRRVSAAADALRATGGNVDAAASVLGVHRVTLHRWLRAWGWQRQPDGRYGAQ